ncbi:MAG: Ppx/GppA phosphatase family protein [Planctomycetota bacterium]
MARDLVAAVDLGSNSFHMIVARMEGGQPRIVDRLRERVALAAGLNARKQLTPLAQRRALAALGPFGQRLRDMPPGAVRAVGTNALRQARNARGFLARARRVLGHPIEVIAGREEARLIYLGVAHSLADEPGRRLVVDIGGGSTECILGERFDTVATDSLYMGCVAHTLRFFPKGDVTRARFEQAEIAARVELEPIERHYRALGWERCVGSSGTILSIESVLRNLGLAEQGVTQSGLKRLRKELLATRRADRLDLPGLSPERVGLLSGGLAILCAVFESLRIERMEVSSSSLREGLLYDLVGRIRHEDARERTIRQLTQRYHVDLEQAGRVERTALQALEQVAEAWELTGEEHRQRLAWAARLHEIGLSISYSGQHKHGAYIVQHADMPGFSQPEKLILAALVGGHRRKLPLESFRELSRAQAEDARRLCLLLRLAVCLNRSRSPRELPAFRLRASRNDLTLRFPGRWLRQQPLTRADLEDETAVMRAAGVRLLIG